MFVCFLQYRDSLQENFGKKIRQKFLPKDGKRMRPVQIFEIWQYKNYRYHLL
jgi:hypothetical protein